MLKLSNIIKHYVTGDTTVAALSGVSVEFRKNEFVSILGHSGCGKTTLLNIIGGLDQYTDGDLIIDGTSTKKFTDADWDNYRNHSIGFVFQSYNLIPHQSVLSNVELALTLSGVSKSERRRRATEALEKVGLADQINKKPNQMSGGQMQRVAIARALVNNPDILLADEPTGALDTETSKQIMEILKEISKDKLVIMVTHNPELAEEYSSRIIRLIDGSIISDSNPFEGLSEPEAEKEDANTKKEKKKSQKKKSMSFVTALSLSLNNLLTKKTRTILTSFAGSIGIIGIALILALSNGIQIYIDQIQEETLSSYPLTINARSEDMTETIMALMSANSEKSDHELNAVYSSPVLNELINSMTNPKYTENNLKDFKVFLENDEEVKELITELDYSYNVPFNVFYKDDEGKVIKSDAMELMQESIGMQIGNMSSFASMSPAYSQMEIYEEMLQGDGGKLISDMLTEQYDVIYGNWPKTYNEVVLIVNQNNEISDFALLALGLTTLDEAKKSWQNIGEGEKLETEVKSWTYDEICNMSFRVVPASHFYSKNPSGNGYIDISTTDAGLTYMYDNGIDIKISGIIRPNPDASDTMLTGTIGYTKALTSEIISRTNQSEIVKEQLASPDTDIILGLPFKPDDYTEPADDVKATDFKEYVNSLTVKDKAELYKTIASTPDDVVVANQVDMQMKGLTREYIETMMLDAFIEESGMDKQTVKDYIAGMSDEELFAQVEEMLTEAIKTQITETTLKQLSAVPDSRLAMMLGSTISSATTEKLAKYYDNHMPATMSESTYDQNVAALGVVSLDTPSTINIYTSTFEAKDKIAEAITRYNNEAADEDKISYTDYVALMMSSITTIINVISYVLIAFVAISLVVSSIMIGIITYISVLERTKEIGILRAIGASKKDVSRVFNAETLIIGFTAGAIGIGLTLLLCLPVNYIIRTLSGISNIGAQLPVAGAIILVVISMLLTFIAGLIPSGIAAKKDPVEALRSE